MLHFCNKLLYKISPDLFPVDPSCPTIAVFTVCKAVVYWKEKRNWAYLMIAGAVISVGFFIFGLML